MTNRPETRRVSPTIRLGRLALDWEMVTARQILKLRLAADEVERIGLDIPACDLFIHLGIMRPNEVNLLVAKAGMDDHELAVRSPLAEVTPRMRELVDRALLDGRVFDLSTIQAVEEMLSALAAVGIELEPWQVVVYRGDLTGERRIGLEVDHQDRERQTRSIVVKEDPASPAHRILRTAAPRRIEVPAHLVVGLAVVGLLIGLPVAGAFLFGEPGRKAAARRQPVEESAGAAPSAGGGDVDPGGSPGAVTAFEGPGVERLDPGSRTDRTGFGRPGSGDPGAAADRPPVPIGPLSAGLERVERMIAVAEARGGGGSDAPPEPPGADAPLVVQAASGSEGDRTAVRVAAEFDAPDGVWLDLVLDYRGVALVARRVAVVGGRFDVTFELPGPGQPPAGVYEAIVTCHPARQHRALARQLRARFPRGIQARIPVAVGTPRQAQDQARHLHGRLAAILAHLAVARPALAEAVADHAGQTGSLGPWRVFLESWRVGVEDHLVAFLDEEKKAYLVGIRPDATAAVHELSLAMSDLARRISRDLHEERGLAVPPEDLPPAIEDDRDRAALEATIDHLVGVLSGHVAALEGLEEEE